MTDAARLALVPVPAAVLVGMLAYARGSTAPPTVTTWGRSGADVQATVLATR